MKFSWLKRSFQTRNNQSGRSMTEMIGVLILVGILSMGALGGYGWAMDKYRSNTLSQEVLQRAADIKNQLDRRRREFDLKKFETTSAIGYHIDLEPGTPKTENNKTIVGIQVDKVPGRICKMTFDSNIGLFDIRVGDNLYPQKTDINTSDVCSKAENTIIFYLDDTWKYDRNKPTEKETTTLVCNGGQTCTSTTECSTGETCYDGCCVEGILCDDGSLVCSADSDCGADLVCADGCCAYPPECAPDQEFCGLTADKSAICCANGASCIAGECVLSCSEDEFLCSDGDCCASESDCDSIPEHCVSDIPLPPICPADKPKLCGTECCALLEICLEDSLTCLSLPSCPGGTKCGDTCCYGSQTCVEEKCTGNLCNSNQTPCGNGCCDSDQTCKNGTCYIKTPYEPNIIIPGTSSGSSSSSGSSGSSSSGGNSLTSSSGGSSSSGASSGSSSSGSSSSGSSSGGIVFVVVVPATPTGRLPTGGLPDCRNTGYVRSKNKKTQDCCEEVGRCWTTQGTCEVCGSRAECLANGGQACGSLGCCENGEHCSILQNCCPSGEKWANVSGQCCPTSDFFAGNCCTDSAGMSQECCQAKNYNWVASSSICCKGKTTVSGEEYEVCCKTGGGVWNTTNHKCDTSQLQECASYCLSKGSGK